MRVDVRSFLTALVSQVVAEPEEVDLAVIAREIVDDLRRQKPQRQVNYLRRRI